MESNPRVSSKCIRAIHPRHPGPLRVAPTLMLLLLAIPGTGWTSTRQTFDAAGQGSPFVAQRNGSLPDPATLDGGPGGAGKFMRLAVANPEGPFSLGTLSFNRSDIGGFDTVIADFDIRIKPGNGRAHGMAFTLLNTAFYGTSGAVAGTAEEPNFSGSLGIGFDVYQNDNLGDIGDHHVRAGFSNSISVHFNGVVLKQTDVSSVVDLAWGRWIHVRVLVKAGAGFSEVSVTLTPQDCAPTIVLRKVKVPGLTPYESRVHFGARSGGETADHDLDNVNVHFLSAAQSLVSLGAVTYTAFEGTSTVSVNAMRSGNTLSTVTAVYRTLDGSTSAGADYLPATGVVTFLPGQASRSFTIKLYNDALTEPDERLLVLLDTPSAGAVIGGPDTAAIALKDDESAKTLGQWSPVDCWPVVGVHVHVLPTGMVMAWNRFGAARLWNPANRKLTVAAQPGYDVFCSGHSFLPDGSLLVTGGHQHGGDPHDDGNGIDNVSLYNPFTNQWTLSPPLPRMNGGRWYPTNTTLANGEALVVAGTVDIAYRKNQLSQVWQTDSRTWRDLTAARDQPVNLAALGGGVYPWVFPAPGGLALKVGPEANTYYLNPGGAGQWTPGPASHYSGVRSYGSAAMYGRSKFLIVGGGGQLEGGAPPTATAEILDLSEPSPSWREVAPMSFARRQHNATLLPDGTVLVTGGSSGSGFNNQKTPVLHAELWNPATESWTLLPPMEVPRLYHSAALLLPDARVLVAGGGEGAEAASQQSNAQIYSPPYLFKGRRPRITTAPASVSYGATFLVSSPDAVRISTISLVRLPSVTHSFDQNQRFVPLAFSVSSDGLVVTTPANGDEAQPGHYMLFLVDDKGVPSVAKILSIH